MHDSYGDGWNGGNLEVLLNGSSIGVFAAQGTGSTATFTVCNGDQLELIYAAQDWEEENTYELFDPWGNVVFADGPAPTAGSAFSGVGDCDQIPAPGSVPCAALPIDTTQCVLANNSAAIGTGIDPGCANYQGGDLWYTMPVPTSGNVVVSTAAADGLNDTGIALWTGPNCFDLTLVGCDDDGGDGYFSRLLGNDLPVGQALFIQVFGYGGGVGAFELCVSDPGTVVLESSELPIILINTLGQQIVDEPKIHALMEIKYNGPGNLTYVTDPANVYNGDIGIEIRGATSSGYPQKPYGLETRDANGANLDTALFCMPAENDWVLLSNYNDRSLLKNLLASRISTGMGQYAPRFQLCEVLVDSAYRGVYVFGEKIKRDVGRVNIAKLDSMENSGDDLTGGYILTQNYWDANNSFQSNFSPLDHPTFDVHFVHFYPDPDVISPPQRTYIASYVDSLETALYSSAFADTSAGYRSYLDVPSFIDYFIVNEVARNNDGFKKSVFFHKDKNSNGGRLKAGPVWDFDWAWKNIAGCNIFSATDGSGWAHRVNDCVTDNYSCGWYVRMLEDEAFAGELRCAYDGYRSTVLDTAFLFHFIDSTAALLQNAQARHFQKWPILGVSGEAPDVGPVATSYSAEIDSLKAWIALRLDWLDAHMPGTCVNIGIHEEGTNDSLSVFPNPSTGQFRFNLGGESRAEISIHDVSGRLVDRFWISGGASVDRMVDGRGTYIYFVREGDRPIRTGKLIVF